jgi:hypothetical protein
VTTIGELTPLTGQFIIADGTTVTTVPRQGLTTPSTTVPAAATTTVPTAATTTIPTADTTVTTTTDPGTATTTVPTAGN